MPFSVSNLTEASHLSVADRFRHGPGSVYGTPASEAAIGVEDEITASAAADSGSWRQWAEEPYPRSPNDGPSEPLQPFRIGPLDKTVDSTRVLVLRPQLRSDGLLDCGLACIRFADRPKFDALSYMWGDQTVKRKISVNGSEREVTENLFHALHFLMRRPDPKNWLPIWVDAVCINQDDDTEKGGQLPFMPHIYERAQNVFVWLGRKYARLQRPGTEENLRRVIHRGLGRAPDDSKVSIDTSIIANGDSDHVFRDNEVAMAEELRADGYWDRVWIIQEIGKARRIKVCFGKMTLNWAEFIYFVSRFKCDQHGPLKFNAMIETYQRLAFKSLLEQHRDAQCWLPKDKVYGLIGLARDTAGFPVHYDQSDMLTWLETMDFVVGRRIVPKDEIVAFARLVKGLLFDHPRAEQPDPSILESLTEPASRSARFNLEAVVVGMIDAVGPSTTEVVSNPGASHEWLRPAMSGATEDEQCAQNDMLKRALLDTDDARIDGMLSSDAVEVLRSGRCFCDSAILNGPSPAVSPTTGPRVFIFDPDSVWATHDLSRLGFVTGQGRPGDTLCYFRELGEILVLRRDEGDQGEIQFVGKCVLTSDLCPTRDLLPGISQEPREKRSSQNLSIGIEAKTLWDLAC